MKSKVQASTSGGTSRRPKDIALAALFGATMPFAMAEVTTGVTPAENIGGVVLMLLRPHKAALRV